VRLSELNADNLSDDEIGNIVFSDIEDNMLKTKFAIVFGSYQLQEYRIKKAIELYKQGRFNKLILSGGSGGISNEANYKETEARLMKNYAIENGVKEEDIYIEEESNNSIENVINIVNMLENIIGVKNLKSLTLITSEFHLKRCLATFKKYLPVNITYNLVPAYDGFTNSSNWFLSDGSWNTGRSLTTYEARNLINYAKQNKIYDLDIPACKKI
jgi:uncharacterized SAM-binding protein YcdF (DUF218 family)